MFSSCRPRFVIHKHRTSVHMNCGNLYTTVTNISCRIFAIARRLIIVTIRYIVNTICVWLIVIQPSAINTTPAVLSGVPIQQLVDRTSSFAATDLTFRSPINTINTSKLHIKCPSLYFKTSFINPLSLVLIHALVCRSRLIYCNLT